MAKNGFLKRHGIVRNAIRKDILQFALPGMTVFIIELQFCVRDGLSGFWGTIWGLVKKPNHRHCPCSRYRASLDWLFLLLD
jgi:hypothetical protein